MTMKKIFRTFLATCIVALGMSQAHAGALYCNGQILELAYHQPGNLIIRTAGMNYGVVICSVNNEWVVPGSLAGNTSVSACKTMYATFLAAKLSGTPLGQLLFDGDSVPATCNSFAPWTNVNVRYFVV